MKDSKVNNSCSPTTNEAYVKPSIQVYEMEIEGTILADSTGTDPSNFGYDEDGWS